MHDGVELDTLGSRPAQPLTSSRVRSRALLVRLPLSRSISKHDCHAFWKLGWLHEHLDRDLPWSARLDLEDLPGENAADDDATGHHRELTVKYLRTQVRAALSAENLNVHVADVIRPRGDQHGMLASHSLFISALPVGEIHRLGILSDNLSVQRADIPLRQQLSHGSSSPVTITWKGSPSPMPYLA